MKLKASIALVLALTPIIAAAQPKPASPRFRTQIARDRAPKARIHVTQVRPR